MGVLLLALAFAYAIATLWIIHTELASTLSNGLSIHVSDNINDEWHQPVEADVLFPDRISAHQWQFDYEVTESILASVKLKSNGELQLDSELAELLTKAVNSMPDNLNDKALKRIAYLVYKGLPDLRFEPKETNNPGKTLSSILINYYRLKYAERSQLKLTDKLANFKSQVELQNHYLGTDIATQLFGKKRSITRYLLDRRAKRLKNISERKNINAQ
jgi:hypothetical protein